MQGVSRESLTAARERLNGTLASADVAAEVLGGELFDAVHLLDGSHGLRRSLSDPSHSGQRKSGLLRSLFADRVSGGALDVLDGVVRATWARAPDLPDAAEVLAVASVVAAAERDGRLDDLEDELFRFGRILVGQPRLRAALSDPAAPAEPKGRLLRDLLEDKVAPATLQLAGEVVERPRNRSIDRGLELYARIAVERRRRLVAIVRSAVVLSEDQRHRLAGALAASYDHEIRLNVEIDPEVIGGLSVRVENELIDGTIAGRLNEIRRRLG